MAYKKTEMTKIDQERIIYAREMKDSDQVMDMFCESCFEDGTENVPAVGFCVDCVTFFCKTCLKFHTKFRRDHVQQSHNEMPKHFCQEKCKIHKNEIVKYYCKKCDCFACSTCKINDHKECASLQYVPTLLSEFEEKREHENFEDMLKAVEEKLQSTKFVIKQGYGRVEQIKEETRSVIQEYKDNTAKLFDDLEREVVTDIDKIGSEDKKNLDENSKKLSELESTFQVIKSENESKKLTNQRCKILIMVKSCNNKVISIKNSLEDLSHETGIHEVSYEPANVLKTTGDFGKLNITKPRTNINLGRISENTTQTERNQTKYGICLWVMGLVIVIAAIIYGNIYYSRFNLENVPAFNAEKSKEIHTSVIREEPIIISKADINTNIKSTPRLFNLLHLCKNYLIAEDINNHLLVLVSTTEKKIVSEFLLQDELCDITKVAENQVAVTFYMSPEIHILQINNMHNSGAISWSVVKKMKNHLCMTDPCEVAYRDEKLFISSESEITVFDMNGNKLKTIFLNIPGSFHIYDYLTIKKNAESLHIFSPVDGNYLKVIHVTSGEQYETSYSHKDLKDPGRMIADDRGNVYVCGHNPHNIHRLSGNLTQGEVLLNETDGIESPWTLAYSNEENKLFVLHSSNISVFKIV
ncbi:uncharacterized protein LOC123546192 [Mercenaria mercenaria]|uniref:uncharacterized protein LOC123546192 n=1 Tax=Mercenaria mercenaria TaxID=6596 RepID=UPI001E1D2A5B|nr:uncharacterized protein LOC123546192 [Mercenaria mercenaria]